jgi:transcriptional regulator with XRE-family HTH domain
MDPEVDSSLAMPRLASQRQPRLPAEGLGQRLARLRKERGFTQVELAKRMGIVQALISDYELEKLRPNPDIIVAFAKAFDVTTDEILGVSQPKRAPVSPVSRRLLRRLQQFDKLPKRDQEALLRTIDAFFRGNAA